MSKQKKYQEIHISTATVVGSLQKYNKCARRGGERGQRGYTGTTAIGTVSGVAVEVLIKAEPITLVPVQSLWLC